MHGFSLSVVTAPTSEPVTLQEAKDHMRLETSDADDRVEALIKAARNAVEAKTKRALMTQTWDLKIDWGFPLVIEVPKPPLQSVSSVTYVDSDGNNQTVGTSVYTVDTDAEPGRIYEQFNQNWPAARVQRQAVTVRFVAGYSSASDVPNALKHAILMMCASMFDNPSEIVTAQGIVSTRIPTGVHNVDALVAPYMVAAF